MSTEAINALIEKQGKAAHNMRALLEDAEKRGEKLSVQEQAQYDAYEKEFDEAEERRVALERLAEREGKISGLTEKRVQLPQPGKQIAAKTGQQDPEDDEVEQYRRYLRGEVRALQADSDPDGGYVVPKVMSNDLIVAVKNNVFMRSLGRVLPPINGASMGVPTLDTDVSDLNWTAEIATVSEDTAMKLGKRELTPHQLATLVKVGRKLLRQATIPMDSFVVDRLGYKKGVTEEKYFLTGNGAGQPLGCFTASNDGIDTSRDCSTGNSSSAVVADNLFENFYNVKPQYSANGTWLVSRTLLKKIRQLKDSQNQYLWQPGLAGGQPSTIIDRPYVVSEYVPSTFTTGLYVGLFGDFSYYWILDSAQMSIQRVEELYTEKNQVGFILRSETDGAPVLAEAFSRIKLG